MPTSTRSRRLVLGQGSSHAHLQCPDIPLDAVDDFIHPLDFVLVAFFGFGVLVFHPFVIHSQFSNLALQFTAAGAEYVVYLLQFPIGFVGAFELCVWLCGHSSSSSSLIILSALPCFFRASACLCPRGVECQRIVSGFTPRNAAHSSTVPINKRSSSL